MREPTPSYAGEHWYQLLSAAVASQGIVAVAKKLGYSNHTGTSQVLSGKYQGGTEKYAARVLKAFDVLACPHLGSEISITVCHETAQARAPMHNPAKLKHWQACRNCPQRPPEGEQK